VLGAVSYKVYGRTPFNRGYLGTVTDTGAKIDSDVGIHSISWATFRYRETGLRGFRLIPTCRIEQIGKLTA
jgi:hypothetical protein